MNPFILLRLLIRLYPRQWRQRYEDEMLALLDLHHITFLTLLDIFFGAVDAHLHPLALAESGPLTMRHSRYAPIIIYSMVPFFLTASFYWITLYWYDFNPDSFSDAIVNTYPIEGLIPILIRFSILVILVMTCIGELQITIRLLTSSRSVLQAALRILPALLVFCSFLTLIPFFLREFDPFLWPYFLREIDPVRLPFMWSYIYESNVTELSFRLSPFALLMSTVVTVLAYWKCSSPEQRTYQSSTLPALVAKVMAFVLFITILWATILSIYIPQIEKHVPHQFIGGDFGWQSRLFMGVTSLALPTIVALLALSKGVRGKAALS